MLLRVFGVIDFAIAAFFAINIFDKLGFFPDKIILIAGIVLLVKGIFFLIFMDFASIIDIICGIIIIISIFIPISQIISALVVIFLLQKAFFSTVS